MCIVYPKAENVNFTEGKFPLEEESTQYTIQYFWDIFGIEAVVKSLSELRSLISALSDKDLNNWAEANPELAKLLDLASLPDLPFFDAFSDGDVLKGDATTEAKSVLFKAFPLIYRQFRADVSANREAAGLLYNRLIHGRATRNLHKLAFQFSGNETARRFRFPEETGLHAFELDEFQPINFWQLTCSNSANRDKEDLPC